LARESLNLIADFGIELTGNECGCGRDYSGESFFQLALRFATSTCKASPCLRAKSDDQERAGRLLTNAKGSLKITLNTAADNAIDGL